MFDINELFKYLVVLFVSFSSGTFTFLMLNRIRRAKGKPSLSKLSSLSDLLPSPQLRKRLKKMMGDQDAHIDALCSAGRFKAAKWIAFTTWLLWFWYVLKSPLSSLLSAAKRAVG